MFDNLIIMYLVLDLFGLSFWLSFTFLDLVFLPPVLDILRLFFLSFLSFFEIVCSQHPYSIFYERVYGRIALVVVPTHSVT